MSDLPVNLSRSGPPETILPAEAPPAAQALTAALAAPAAQRRALIAAVVADHPRMLSGWAALGEHADDVIERYAYFRVGYHRGLDTLRANSWRGNGWVRWTHPTNRPFLRNLRGLRDAAGTIGEADEHARCNEFLLQLDPSRGWEQG